MSITPTHNGSYLSEHIDLTGISFLGGAAFQDCVIESRDQRRPDLPGCYFNNCTFVGSAWPEKWREARMIVADTDLAV